MDSETLTKRKGIVIAVYTALAGLIIGLAIITATKLSNDHCCKACHCCEEGGKCCCNNVCTVDCHCSHCTCQ